MTPNEARNNSWSFRSIFVSKHIFIITTANTTTGGTLLLWYRLHSGDALVYLREQHVP